MNATENPQPVKGRDEEDYLEIARLGAKLGVPIPLAHVVIDVHDNNTLISHYEQRSRSWNRNFWNLILLIATRSSGVATNFGAGYLSVKSTDATVAALADFQTWPNLSGAINVSTNGIQAGTGAAAESFEGYALNTICANGTGANQLVYSAASANAQAYVAGTKTWTVTLKRLFNNNSAADILVTETAITGLRVGGTKYDMICRDLLAVPQNVAVGLQLTVSYPVTLVFPA